MAVVTKYTQLWVRNFAELRALDPPAEQDFPMSVLGALQAGDGSGGVYMYSLTNALADNGMLVIKPVAVAAGSPGRWLRFTKSLTFDRMIYRSTADPAVYDTTSAHVEGQGIGAAGNLHLSAGTTGVVISDQEHRMVDALALGITSDPGVLASYTRLWTDSFDGSVRAIFPSGVKQRIAQKVDLVSADHGDTSVTLNAGFSPRTNYWNTPLTADRSVTLASPAAINGDRFTIVRGPLCTGPFDLTIGAGSKALTEAGQWCVVEWNGSTWIVTQYGSTSTPSDTTSSVVTTPQMYGAVANGVFDCTSAIQQAVNASGIVFFPAGRYLCNGIITIPSNRFLYGAGIDVTVLVRNGSNGDGLNFNGQGLLFADSGAPGSYVSNIYVSDMTLDGQVATKGFAEWTHLIAFSGVKDCLIERVKFLGFRGDGILLGHAHPHITALRHTVNTTVQDCIFDGVNSDNRNGISVIDADGVFIRRNTFRNCTKSTMPGPIDIEPDGIDSILRNIDIDSNRIESTSGNGGIIVQVSFSLTTQLQDIKIRNNRIAGMTVGGAVAIAVQTIEAALGGNTSMAVAITGNTVYNPIQPVYPFRVIGIRGLRIAGNTFKNTYYGQLANPTSVAVLVVEADIVDNVFDLCGNIPPATGYNTVLVIGSVDRIRIHQNTFDKPNNLYAIYFLGDGVTTASANVSVVGNRFVKGGVQTHSVRVSNHTFSANGSVCYDNTDVLGAMINDLAYLTPSVNALEIFLSGNLTTQTGIISLAAQNGATFSVDTIVEAKDNTLNTSTQNHTVQKDTIIGYNAAAGAVTIQGVANISTLVQDISAFVPGKQCVITYTATGENLIVHFAGTEYANANAFARITAIIK